jgi:hypothetical protein
MLDTTIPLFTNMAVGRETRKRNLRRAMEVALGKWLQQISIPVGEISPFNDSTLWSFFSCAAP